MKAGSPLSEEIIQIDNNEKKSIYGLYQLIVSECIKKAELDLIYDKNFSPGLIFNWDEIPGENGNKRLKNFLSHNFMIHWVEKAELEKIQNGRTIKIFDENNYLSLFLNDEEKKVILTIDDGRTEEFIAIMEKNGVNVYNSIEPQVPWAITVLELEDFAPGYSKSASAFEQEIAPILFRSVDGKDFEIEPDSISSKYHDQGLYNMSLDSRLFVQMSRRSILCMCQNQEQAPAKYFIPVLLDICEMILARWHVLLTINKIIDDTLHNFKGYSFSWDYIPGTDENRFLEFLATNFGIDWVWKARIEKIDYGRKISISNEKDSLLLILNLDKAKATMKIDEGRIVEFVVKTKNNLITIQKSITPKEKLERIMLVSDRFTNCHEDPSTYLCSGDTLRDIQDRLMDTFRINNLTDIVLKKLDMLERLRLHQLELRWAEQGEKL